MSDITARLPVIPDDPSAAKDARKLAEKWLSLFEDIRDTLQDTVTAVKAHGKAPMVAALGPEWAALIVAAFPQLKPIALRYNEKNTEIDDIPK